MLSHAMIIHVYKKAIITTKRQQRGSIMDFHLVEMIIPVLSDLL